MPRRRRGFLERQREGLKLFNEQLDLDSAKSLRADYKKDLDSLNQEIGRTVRAGSNFHDSGEDLGELRNERAFLSSEIRRLDALIPKLEKTRGARFERRMEFRKRREQGLEPVTPTPSPITTRVPVAEQIPVKPRQPDRMDRFRAKAQEKREAANMERTFRTSVAEYQPKMTREEIDAHMLS
ncbi:MAG: hypothetical protein F4X72_08135 [Dehalococcoidia bacterium]|nr:hypothetical protein [Dehalococcoidia bacterium]